MELVSEADQTVNVCVKTTILENTVISNHVQKLVIAEEHVLLVNVTASMDGPELHAKIETALLIVVPMAVVNSPATEDNFAIVTLDTRGHLAQK